MVEAVFGIVALMFLTVVVIQLVMGLYARNVVLAAAHEAARAAIEVGVPASAGDTVALRTIHRSAGGLLTDVKVHTELQRHGPDVEARIEVGGTLHPPGPIPWSPPIHVLASATREALRGAR
ncbi:MAG TPA: hypothetical protein VFK89_06970 [Actinomycetota bacterium]|nr:hypothetical protein [Actinomycetota bacterium]